MSNAPDDPIDLAMFTIAKYGDDSHKPSVRLALEVRRMVAEIALLRSGLLVLLRQVDRGVPSNDSPHRFEQPGELLSRATPACPQPCQSSIVSVGGGSIEPNDNAVLRFRS